MQPSLFTRLAVAEAELQAMKNVLAEALDTLAEMKANQDELRHDHDEWRWWAEHVLTDQRKSRRLRVMGWIRMSDPVRLIAEAYTVLRPNGLGLILRVLAILLVGLVFWQVVLDAGKP